MLGNLNDFSIFINWFHYTQKKMFDACITILHMHQTVEHWRSPGRFVVEFWVFIDWSHPNIPHTHHDARRPPQNFSFLSFPGTNFPGTIFSGTIFPRTILPGIIFSGTNFLGTNFPGTIFAGTIFPRTIFPGDHFSGTIFLGDHFSGIQILQRTKDSKAQ